MKVNNILFEQPEAELLVNKQKAVKSIPRIYSCSYVDVYQPLVTYSDIKELPSKPVHYPFIGFKVML